MLSRVHSMGLRGVQGFPVVVELDIANGLPNFSTVGLPDHAVREARERVVAAVRNSGFTIPSRRITVNLAPALTRKEGSHYDLPIALALLAASGQAPDGDWLKTMCFVGELSLDGRVRPISGALAMAERARAAGFSAIVVPEENASEAAHAGISAHAARNLADVIAIISGVPVGARPDLGLAPRTAAKARISALDMSDIKGQAAAKRALEIAAAGGHNAILIGPPGAGKSMLAKRFPSLLPPLERAEAVEVTKIQSAGGGAPAGLAVERPFRAPHHTSSAAALVGGGSSARLGEICLAHCGVLFLDELAEFNRPALEALRQPLEDRVVCVARSKYTLEYPARFLLIAATNPCPCGYAGHPQRSCTCAAPRIAKYLSRLSGPLIDRIDLQIEVSPVPFSDWAGTGVEAGSTRAMGARVTTARTRQKKRWKKSATPINALVEPAAFRADSAVSPEAFAALAAAQKLAALSARSLDRVLRVSRTIADLEGSASVAASHIAEAMQYRAIDKLRANLARTA